MKGIWNKIFAILSGFFLIYGIVMLRYYPGSESVVIIIILALFSLLLCVFWKGFLELFKKSKLLKVCTALVLAVVVLFISVQGLIISRIYDNYSGESDVIMILGAGIKGNIPTGSLKHRLDEAKKYVDKHDDVLIIVSGGPASSDASSEAQIMKEYLVAEGVNANRILLEERSANTLENFSFSKNVLDTVFQGDTYTIVYVTSAFHVYRCSVIAKDFFKEAYGIASNSTWYLLPVHHVREFLSILNMWFSIFY